MSPFSQPPMISDLAKTHRTIALDLSGHGLSHEHFVGREGAQCDSPGGIPNERVLVAHRIDDVRCYAVGMASMNEIFVWWPLIVAVPVAIVLGVAIAAMFSDKP